MSYTEILGLYLKGETLKEDVTIDYVARRTELFSGSDLKHLCVSAALAAVKDTIPSDWAQRKPTDATKLPAVITDGDATVAPSIAADGEVASTPVDVPPPIMIKPRVISMAHFTVAFSEVTASSSESMESVKLLREWSANFKGAAFGG